MRKAKVESEKLTVKMIPVEQVNQPVIDMRGDTGGWDLVELTESIRQVGLINPIRVKPAGDNYEVVAGARRLRAITQLGWERIAAIVFPRNGLSAELAKMHENLVRQSVSPLEEAQYLQDLATAYKLNGQQLASKINRTASYVSERLALLKAPAQLREAVAQGALSFSAARELARIRNQDVRDSYINHAIRSGINDTTARQWRMDANAAERAGEQATTNPGSPKHDNVETIRVQCALTGKTVAIENTVLVRIHKPAWEAILADMQDAKPT